MTRGEIQCRHGGAGQFMLDVKGSSRMKAVTAG